jgi:hypothetical protein
MTSSRGQSRLHREALSPKIKQTKPTVGQRSGEESILSGRLRALSLPPEHAQDTERTLLYLEKVEEPRSTPVIQILPPFSENPVLRISTGQPCD